MGRDFTHADIGADVNRTVIDETLATLAFPGRNAVGELIQIGRDGEPDDFAEIVGVVSHIHLHDLTEATLPQLYWPMSPGGRYSVVVETASLSPALLDQVRTEVRALGSTIPIEDVRSMEVIVDDAMAQPRLNLGLMAAFGALALLLSAGGLYGVISYAVTQRTREIGIRMALGQTPASIGTFVAMDSARLVAAAVVVGILAAAALGQVMSTMLYSVSPIDVPTYVIVAALLGGTALSASWIPMRRAIRVDPMAALRAD